MVSASNSKKQASGGNNFLMDFMSSQQEPIDFRPKSEPGLNFDDNIFDFFNRTQSSMEASDTKGRAAETTKNVASRQDIFSKFGLGILLSEFGDIFGVENSDELLSLLSPEKKPEKKPKKEPEKQQAPSFSEDEIMKLVQQRIDELGIRYEKSPTQRGRDRGQRGDTR